MMTRLRLLAVVCMLVALLAGCGGPEDALAPPAPPSGGGDAARVQVGPLLVRPASAAGFAAQEIPNPNGPISLVALHGSRINYLASQALLDRIVFSRGSGSDFDIIVCNLDGSGAVRLINNAASDQLPAWSPDGQRIAFERTPAGQDSEIVVMNADGSGPHALTANTDVDSDPTWSPDGRRIAFEAYHGGNAEIYVMYDDGFGQTNLTNNGAEDRHPDWSPNLSDSTIVFASTRDNLNGEIYEMHADGSGQTRLTNNAAVDLYPAYDPWGDRIAWESTVQGTLDIVIGEAGGPPPCDFSARSGHEQYPAWSSDARFICYSATVGADYELVLQETEPPYGRFVLTNNAPQDLHPDLGSPTMQTDRVIIGPAGTDWGGCDPIWQHSDAGIVAYDDDGYRSFVRIGIRSADLPTLSVTPLAAPSASSGAPLGVLVEAAEIVNLREDGGRGREAKLWLFDALNPTAVAAYFDGHTGKLIAALVLADQSYPTGAAAPGAVVTERLEGGALVVEGAFTTVFDATGARIADAVSEVRIAEGAVDVVR